jgi:hypothetical protein
MCVCVCVFIYIYFKSVYPEIFNEDRIVVYYNFVRPPIFNHVINVAYSFTINSFKSEKPLTFNFENILILSDVILFASMSFKLH